MLEVTTIGRHAGSQVLTQHVHLSAAEIFHILSAMSLIILLVRRYRIRTNSIYKTGK